MTLNLRRNYKRGLNTSLSYECITIWVLNHDQCFSGVFLLAERSKRNDWCADQTVLEFVSADDRKQLFEVMPFSFILNQYFNDTQQNSLAVIVKHFDSGYRNPVCHFRRYSRHENQQGCCFLINVENGWNDEESDWPERLRITSLN